MSKTVKFWLMAEVMDDDGNHKAVPEAIHKVATLDLPTTAEAVAKATGLTLGEAEMMAEEVNECST